MVYTGDHGTEWVTYPDGWPSTYSGGQAGYWPSQVLSVHDGVLDYYLHDYQGLPAGANLSPILPSGSRYQTYGRYSVRMKVVYDESYHLDDYKVAWLLWPQSNTDGSSAESDFPEVKNLSYTTVEAFAHYGGSGAQDAFTYPDNLTDWHTYTQEWGPGYRKYYLDGTLIGTSTNQVWSQPERWQLQTEPSSGNTNDGATGHVLVDWAAIYEPS